MKKVYSQKASTEVFALAPEQLAVFKSAGYETPTAEEAIADAGTVKLTPPEGKRAYVAFDFKAGEFFVRVKTCTLRGNEYSALVKELIEAALLRGQVVQADPDRPKATAPAVGENVSPFASLLTEGLKKSLTEGLAKSLLGSLVGAAFTQAPTTTPSASSPAAGASSGEVVE